MSGILGKPRKKHVQLTLDKARRPDGRHGGWRPNAGRPRRPGAVSHDIRPELKPRFPQHVTLRFLPDVGSVARDFLMSMVRRVIRSSQKPTFRIVEFNVLTNHLHLITEVAGKVAMSRGIQGFKVRFARNLNSALNRKGEVFAQRYHVIELTTPTQVRYALRYVLLNRKHHAAEKKFSKTWFDPWSSAAWFDGWSAPLYANASWQAELLKMERPTARAQTWLLSTGWRKLGLLRLDDRPR